MHVSIAILLFGLGLFVVGTFDNVPWMVSIGLGLSVGTLFGWMIAMILRP